MTRAQALNRIDRLVVDPDLHIQPGHALDARRLVEALPARALEALREGKIRVEPIERDRVEFFWSRSADLMAQGNRITRLHTLGEGRFAVLTGEPDSIRWQCSPDGHSLPEVLALDSDGSEALLIQLVEWQAS